MTELTLTCDASIYAKAIDYLSRREHSETELAQKLARVFYDQEAIGSVLHQLIAQGYLSDARYAEMIIRAKSNQGYGPKYIKNYLFQKGVPSSTVVGAIHESDVDWLALKEQVREKRFGTLLNLSYNDRVKQMQYLQRKGF